MMDLSSALGYCDKAMQDTLTFGQGSLAWLERNDLQTRGKMATYIRRGWTAAAALHEALRESHLDWRAPAAMNHGQDVEPPFRTKKVVEPASSAGASAGLDGPPKKRQIKADNFPTVSQVKGGAKLRKPFNDGRGCTQTQCSALHVCDVRLANGQACPSKKHTRLAHPRE